MDVTQGKECRPSLKAKLLICSSKLFSKYVVLQDFVGKWYIRAPIAQSDKSYTSTHTATRSTMEEEGNYDDSEDESRL